MRVTFPHRLLPYLLRRPAARDQPGLLLLARRPGAAPVGAARGPVRPQQPTFVGLANFHRVLADPAYLNSVQVTVVFSVCDRLPLDGDRAPPRRAGRQDRPRQGLLPHAADLALRRRRRHRRHALALPVQPVLRHARLAAAPARHRLGPAAERQPGDGAGRSAPPPGSRSATTSCSSSPACRRSRNR